MKTHKYDKENLNDCKVFETSFVNKSENASKLKCGEKFDQAIFLIQSTLQFYYEFDVKLSKALQESGEKWQLKLSMKENLLRIAEKINEYGEKEK